MAIAAMHALVLLAPPLLSTDVFSYQFYARMGALYGANPYLARPARARARSVFPYIGAKWVIHARASTVRCSPRSATCSPRSRSPPARSRTRRSRPFASLGIVALVWNAARLRGIDPVRAAALVGLNPLLVVYGVGGGHNDLLMLLAWSRGACTLSSHRGRVGGRADGRSAPRSS